MLESRPYLRFLCQALGFIGAFGVFTLTTLYLAQNHLIYLPGSPIRYPADNPEGYRNPGDRGMRYKDIEVETSDNVKIRGWFIH